ncbi:VanZ family protein [Niallia sp. Krafla_26]|uniref:VanZ family protein n=1 Tax=Niallia sp. Krafla_26 TaxID=3064703 RepID=UPI003D17B0DF
MLKIILRVLPLLYMIVIFILSSMPADAVVELPRWDSLIKESLHLVEFGILYILLFLAALTIKEVSPRLNLILILISSLYGLSDEVHQYFVPYRSATVIDLIKDVIGVLVASWIVFGAYQRKRFHKLGNLLYHIGNLK